MLLLGSALCLLGALRPPTEASPAELNAVLTAVGLGVAALLWWSPAGGRRGALHLAGAVYVLASTAVIAEAATGEGAISTALSHVWLSTYAAVFFRRRTARAYAAVSAGALAVGLALNEAVVTKFASWIVVASTLLVAVEIFSALLGRLRAMALTDELTGLLSRAAVHDRFRREQAAAGRTGEPLTLAVIDLDGFKEVNDRDGHLAGDRLLVALAQEWRRAVRPRDAVFRYGGDEFLLLLPATSEDDALALMARLHRTSAASWSYGVGLVDAADDLDAAVGRADRRMYLHKAGARRG